MKIMRLMKKSMNKFSLNNLKYQIKLFIVLSIIVFGYSTAAITEAASMSLSPSTGVYSSNNTFSARILVNTGGKLINAAEGVVSFNPKELSVVSVIRNRSIFSLWVQEPS